MKIVLATRNAQKARELKTILGCRIQVLTLDQVAFSGEMTETGATLEENAGIKARQVAIRIRAEKRLAPETFVIALADDSGLEVDALGGAPGVRSARYAGESANDRANVRKLLGALTGLPGQRRRARFRCVLAAIPVRPGQTEDVSAIMFEGICEGRIGYRPKGVHGFGYDPIFFPLGSCRTFAEITAKKKNELSHRAMAMAKFKDWLSKQGFAPSKPFMRAARIFHTNRRSSADCSGPASAGSPPQPHGGQRPPLQKS